MSKGIFRGGEFKTSSRDADRRTKILLGDCLGQEKVQHIPSSGGKSRSNEDDEFSRRIAGQWTFDA